MFMMGNNFQIFIAKKKKLKASTILLYVHHLPTLDRMSCTRGTVIALAANGSPYGGYSARGFKSLANQQIDQLRNGDTLKLDPAKFQGDASWRMSWSSEFGYKIFAVIGDTDDVDPTKQIMTFASDADLDAANKSDGITISASTAAVAAQVENAVANGNSDMVADEIARLQAEAEIARAEIARLRNAVEYQMDNDDNESVGGMSIARGSGPGMPPQSGMMPPQSGMMPAQSGMMMPPQSGMMMPAQSGMMQAQSGMMQAQSGMTHSVTTSQVDALAGSLSRSSQVVAGGLAFALVSQVSLAKKLHRVERLRFSTLACQATDIVEAW